MRLTNQVVSGPRAARIAGCVFIVLVALLVSAHADAQERRARRYEDVATQLGERQERDLDDGIKEDLTHAPVEREEARPTLDFEQFRRTVELQVADKRRSQIDTLSRIVQMGPHRDEAPDLLFRLAELYWEEARYYFFEANAKDDEIISARARNDERQVRALLAEQEALSQQSEDYRLRSIERYREIVRDYPEYDGLDQVLFSLGSNLWERNQADEALRVYGALVQRYPNSDYVPDAYLAVAEHHFREGNVRVAQRGYERAIAFTDSRVYGYALYKLGWALFNLADYEGAADLWRTVVYYGELATDSGDNKMALVREARRDFVLAYSHYGDPRQAIDAFKQLGGDEHWPRMMRSLAGLYYDDGKNREAIVAYRLLIDLDPLSPEAPLFQARIVDAGQRIGNKRFTVNQARVLVETFEAVKEAGRVTTDEERKLLTDAETMAERTLRSLAVTWHSEARKTRSEETYWFAYELYKDYLSLFPHSSYEYQLRFYFAELLFYLEKWADAGEQYSAIVEIDAARKRGERMGEDGAPEEVGEYLADASFAAVLAFEEVVQEFDKTEVLPQVEPPALIDVPPPRQALIDACENYLEHVPDGADFISITYMMANTYYRYNRLEDAVEKFSIIALRYPNHDLAEYSVNLILDSYNLLDKPDKVNEWARRFAANPVLNRGDLGKELRQLIEASALTMTERLADAGNHVETAQAYEAFVREFPDSKRADAALFNASVAWATARNLDQALALRARIIRDYPASNLVPDAIHSTAAGHESVAEWERAVEFYELYFQRFVDQQQADARARQRPAARRTPQRGRQQRGRAPTPPPEVEEEVRYEESKAQQALFQAAMLREGLGDFAASRAHRLRYVEMWPSSDESQPLFRSVADLFEREKAWVRSAQHLAQYMTRYGNELSNDQKLLLEYRRIRLYEKAGQPREVDRIYEDVRAAYRALGSNPERLEGGMLPVAIAEMRTLEPQYQAFTQGRLEYPWRESQRPHEITQRLQRRPSQALVNRLQRGIETSDNGFRESLDKMNAELQKIVGVYTQVVQYRQGEPALCALEKIGDAYLDFLTRLRAAPGPPYLRAMYELQLFVQEEEADPEVDLDKAFRDGLSELARPLEDQAVEAWSAAVDNGRSLGLHTECARSALAKVRALRPDRYPVIVELRAEPAQPPSTLRKGESFLTEIQPLPEASEGEGGLPADVAAVPRPDGRAVQRSSESQSEGDRPSGGRGARERGGSERQAAGESEPAPRGRRAGDPDTVGLPPPDQDLLR